MSERLNDDAPTPREMFNARFAARVHGDEAWVELVAQLIDTMQLASVAPDDQLTPENARRLLRSLAGALANALLTRPGIAPDASAGDPEVRR